jgi:hypothetical protein
LLNTPPRSSACDEQALRFWNANVGEIERIHVGLRAISLPTRSLSMNEIRIASVAHPYRLFQRRPDHLNHNQLDVARRFGATMGVNAAGGDALVGIHGVKADLHLERFWSQNIAFTTRLVDAGATPVPLRRCSPRSSIKNG